jgi:hypothetical protein
MSWATGISVASVQASVLTNALALHRARRTAALAKFTRHHPTMAAGICILFGLLTYALAAPLVVKQDPIAIDVVNRLNPPSDEQAFGTRPHGS